MNALRFIMHDRYLLLLVLGIATAALQAAPADSGGAIHFNRDIRPVLSEHCLACHGPDPVARKADLRLDTKAGLFETTPERGPAVVPGKPEASVLWQRITTDDSDDLMPPPKANKPLSQEQKEAFRRWILAGAPWQDHWAFIKPERPPIPTVAQPGFEIRTPIDAFVLDGLREAGLSPAPEADRRTLARRLALDLTGLPPTPEEVEAFVNDPSHDYYEKYYQRLMSSAHWGEHRARYWLDAARYADTHGLHFDNYREIWPYRDWVIRAFNNNMPFDQFTVEQIAGDLLENPSQDQLVATGFQRCNMTTNEGGTIEEENLAFYADDRVTTTGWVFMGLTMNCSACHDHKFDPITARDFYSMAAFFRNTTQSGFDRNWREGDVYIVAPQTASDRDRWSALPGEMDAAKAARDQQQADAAAAFKTWLAQADPAGLNPSAIRFSNEHLHLPLNGAERRRISGSLNDQSFQVEVADQSEWRTDGPLGMAPVITKEHAIELGDVGDVDRNEPFSIGAWVYIPSEIKGEASVAARMGGEDLNHRGWDFFVRSDDFGINFVHRWPSVAMKVRAGEKVLKRGEWQHIAAVHDGTGRADGVKLYLNGEEVKTNADQNRLERSVRVDVPMRIGRREKGNEFVGGAVQDLRLYNRRLDPTEIHALAAAPHVRDWMEKPDSERTDAERKGLQAYHHVAEHSGWQETTARLVALQLEQDQIRGRSPVAHIQREKKDSEPTAHILIRGQYDRPGEKVTANTPAAFPPMPKDAPKNRLGLAQWLISPENPLTARVTVNRFWQEIFGTGLVKTSEDFGVMGERPSNQALLDWLAVEFQESGWDVKHLFKLIVRSSTYRQSATASSEKIAKDPENRLLSRGPRFRMDAEMIRDYALAVSGLLRPAIGGPSVHPYQPPGVWEAVAMPESNTRFYDPEDGANLYRRSLYTFWKRAAPPASMDILNAPSRETCTVRRERTDTPLQALVTLNDPQFVEAARALATQAAGCGDADRALDLVAARALARPLSSDERRVVLQTYTESLNYYRDHPDAAAEFLSVGKFKPETTVNQPELAALTLVANQLLNLDEALNK